MKTLTTKSVNIVICWNNLKNLPPKAFQTIEEMEITQVILDTLEEAIPLFSKIIKEGEELNKKIITGDVTGTNVAEVRKEWSERSRKLEEKEKDKEVTIEFENEEFNTFFQQFGRLGKEWFNSVKEFLSFRADLNKTNQQPKEKKEKKEKEEKEEKG